jgi:hypothetical protein
MFEPSDDLRAFAGLKGWAVTESNGQLFSQGRDAGLHWYLWTNLPALEPSLTMVVEARPGFSFEIHPGPVIRPGILDSEIELDREGRKHLVKARHISAAAQSWIDSLEPGILDGLALEKGEQMSVHRESVAITFQPRGLDHALRRAGTLTTFAKLFPPKKAHTLPRELRPISPLIRTYSISDDAKREARLAAASRQQLEELVSDWRKHLTLINATIDERPDTSLSIRLMAFSQAAQEAEVQLRGARP